MKIAKQKNTKKILLISIAGLVICGAVGLSAMYLLRPKPQTTTATGSPINLDKPTNDQIKAGQDIKSNSVNSSPKTEPTKGASGKNIVDMTATSFSNKDNGMLRIQTIIQVIETSGSCTLTLAKAGQPTVTRTVDTQALASSSTCKGFDIPLSELSSGTWGLSISYESAASVSTFSKSVQID